MADLQRGNGIPGVPGTHGAGDALEHKEMAMRGLNSVDLESVCGGQDLPGYPGPSREEVERQIDQLRDFLEEQERRNALPPHA